MYNVYLYIYEYTHIMCINAFWERAGPQFCYTSDLGRTAHPTCCSRIRAGDMHSILSCDSTRPIVDSTAGPGALSFAGDALWRPPASALRGRACL